MEICAKHLRDTEPLDALCVQTLYVHKGDRICPDWFWFWWIVTELGQTCLCSLPDPPPFCAVCSSQIIQSMGSDSTPHPALKLHIHPIRRLSLGPKEAADKEGQRTPDCWGPRSLNNVCCVWRRGLFISSASGVINMPFTEKRWRYI